MRSIAALLAEKRKLEVGFAEAGAQSALHENMSILRSFNREGCGILDFRWPGVPFPLYMRCGSSDLSNFGQMFVAQEYGFPLDFAPARILDLGAYAGYAAVYLARRFPFADIVCVEPSLANFQMLTLNTAASSRIRRLNVAAWGHSSNLDVASTMGGDWGVRLTEANDHATGLPALSIPDILKCVGWDRVDFLKCDIEGAEVSVFAESGALIAGMVQCCAVETHDAIAPHSSRTVKQTFPASEFVNSRHGEFEVFVRRNAALAGSNAISPISVLRPEQGVRPITLTNVQNEGWAYYMFDIDSCQLHPAKREEPAAELATVVELSGHTRFQCQISVENPLGFAVNFNVELRDLTTGLQVINANKTAEAGRREVWDLVLGRPVFGFHRIMLRTLMASNAPSNHQAFANWIAPTFRG